MVNKYPFGSITNPDPEPPPSVDIVSIDTTEGKTLAAMPATESGERSMVEVDETKLTPLVIKPLVASPPSMPPSKPATNASTTIDAVGSVRFLPAFCSRSSRKIN